MKTKTGRPRKVSIEEKKALVNSYYITIGGEDARSLQKHGIYTKLADFAKQSGYPLESYDFSKDPEIVEYLCQLTYTATPCENDYSVAPAYEPLDISSALNMTRGELELILRQREEYFLHLYKRAVAAISSFSAIDTQRKQFHDELHQLRAVNQELESTVLSEKREVYALQKEVAHLRRIIRKHIDPERAAAFLSSVDSKTAEAAVAASMSAVMADPAPNEQTSSVLYLFE